MGIAATILSVRPAPDPGNSNGAAPPVGRVGAPQAAGGIAALESDKITISTAARSRLESEQATAQDLAIEATARESTDRLALLPQALGRSADRRIRVQLDTAQLRQLTELRTRDLDVRAHEQAHVLAAGPFISGPATFTFVRGPDGRQFAVGGSVQIDTAPIRGDPQATVRKEAQVERAALAPRDPSAQDRRIAARARAAKLNAQRELQALQREQDQAMGGRNSGSASGASIDRFA